MIERSRVVFIYCIHFAQSQISKVKLCIHDRLKQLIKQSPADFVISQVLQKLLDEELRAFPDRANMGAGNALPGFAILAEDFADKQWIDKPRELGCSQLIKSMQLAKPNMRLPLFHD